MSSLSHLLRKRGCCERQAVKGVRWVKTGKRNMGEKAAAGHKLVSARNKLLFWICSNIASFPGQGHYLWSQGNFLDWDARFVRMSELKSNARSKALALLRIKKS